MKLTTPLFMLAGALALPAAAQSFGETRYNDTWAFQAGAPRPFAWRGDDIDRHPMMRGGFVFQPEPEPTQPEPAAPVTPDAWLAAGVTPIPEPTTSALLLAGLGVVGLLYRRRSRK